MYIKKELIVIDTEDLTAPIAYSEESNDAFTPVVGDEINTHLYTRRHLYVVTNDPHDTIKDGEWYLVKINYGDGGRYIKESLAKFKTGEEELYKQYDAKKVVVSTDKTLGLPTFNESFIDDYCNAYKNNLNISELLVKYKLKGKYWNNKIDNWDDRLILYVSDSNTISALPIKQNWDRNELVDLLEGFKKQNLSADNYLKNI